MDYAAFASDLPQGRTITFRSAEENQEAMRREGVTQEMRQLGRGSFRCDMAVRFSEQAELYADRFNRAFSMRLEPPRGKVGLLLLRSVSGEGRTSGQDAANDRMVFLPEGSGTDMVAPDLLGSEAMTLPTAQFAETAEALCPTPKSIQPDQMAVIRGDEARLKALKATVLDLIARPEQDPLGERLSNLIEAMAAWMGHASTRWRPEGLIGNGARARVAKRAQEFIEAHHRNAIRMEDLCRVTGVGARTVQRSFREYFDLTITDYLKTVRLDAAHRELLAARPSQKSVTAVGLGHGFGHLGRFSVEFHERFGESPSETLRRAPGVGGKVERAGF